jgi:putative DNA primase/helicase
MSIADGLHPIYNNGTVKNALKSALLMQDITPLKWFEFLYTGTVSQGYAEFRLLPAGKSVFMEWPTFKEHPSSVVKPFAQSGKAGVYFGVALRSSNENGKKENCKASRLLHVDRDLKDYPDFTNGQTDLLNVPAAELEEYKEALLKDTLEKCDQYGVWPVAIVDSGQGLHIYFARHYSTDQSDTERFNKVLALAFGGDKNVFNADRILRLPNSEHRKNPDRVLKVRVLYADKEAKVGDDQLEQLSELVTPKPAAKAEVIRSPETRKQVSTGEGRSMHLKYAQAALAGVLENIRTAPEGQSNEALGLGALRVGELLHLGLNEAECVAELEQVARERGCDPITPVIQNRIAKGKTQPFTPPPLPERPKKERKGKKEGVKAERIAYEMPSFPQSIQENTDAANALILLANGIDSSLRYVFGIGWYVYQPERGVWAQDDNNLTFASVQAGVILRAVVGQYFAQALENHADPDELGRIGRWAGSVCNVGTVAKALKMCVSLDTGQNVLSQPDLWDAHPQLLNCKNGVLNLKTGELLPHDPSYLMTWQTGANYDPTAKHEYVDQLIDLLKADGRHEFIQRSAGSALYGEAPNEAFTVLQGLGGSGKGTLVSAITGMLGDYAGTVEVSLLLQQAHGESSTGPKPELLMLRGKRLIIAGEPPKGARFNAGRVKGMTGNDPITARAMHSNVMVTYKPVFKLWIHTNYPIAAAHDDTGMQRRMKVVPFNAKPNKPNATFKAVLEHDPLARSAVLNWALEGCRAWLEADYSLGESEAIQEATSGYWEEQNPYEKFVFSCLRFEPNGSIDSSRLKTLFEEWCEENGHTLGRATKITDLHTFLKAHKCEAGRTKKGRFWYGVTEVTEVTAVPQFLPHAYTRMEETGGQGVTSVTSVTLSDSDTPDREVF